MNDTNKEKKNIKAKKEKTVKEPRFKKKKIDKANVLACPYDFVTAANTDFVMENGLFSCDTKNYLSFCIRTDLFQDIGRAVIELRKMGAVFSFRKLESSYYFFFYSHYKNLLEFQTNDFETISNNYLRVLNGFNANAVLLNLSSRLDYLISYFGRYMAMEGVGSLLDNPARLVRFNKEKTSIHDRYLVSDDVYYSVLVFSKMPFYDAFDIFGFINDYKDVCDFMFYIYPSDNEGIRKFMNESFLDFNSWKGRIERKDISSSRVLFNEEDDDEENAASYFTRIGLSVVIRGNSEAVLKKNIESFKSGLLNKGFDFQLQYGIYDYVLFKLAGFSFDGCPLINIKTSMIEGLFGISEDKLSIENDSDIMKLFGF